MEASVRLESDFICPDVLRHYAMVFLESAIAYLGHRMMSQIQAGKVTVGVRAIPLSPPWVAWSLWWKWEKPQKRESVIIVREERT